MINNNLINKSISELYNHKIISEKTYNTIIYEVDEIYKNKMQFIYKYNTIKDLHTNGIISNKMFNEFNKIFKSNKQLTDKIYGQIENKLDYSYENKNLKNIIELYEEEMIFNDTYYFIAHEIFNFKNFKETPFIIGNQEKIKIISTVIIFEAYANITNMLYNNKQISVDTYYNIIYEMVKYKKIQKNTYTELIKKIKKDISEINVKKKTIYELYQNTIISDKTYNNIINNKNKLGVYIINNRKAHDILEYNFGNVYNQVSNDINEIYIKSINKIIIESAYSLYKNKFISYEDYMRIIDRLYIYYLFNICYNSKY